MTIKEMQKDILERVGDVTRKAGNWGPYVLKMINRKYREINTSEECLEKKYIFNFKSLSDHAAEVYGNQNSVNAITVATGHDIEVGDEVYNRAWMGKRTVSASDATSITIDGLPVSVVDEDEIKTLTSVIELPSDWIKPIRLKPYKYWRDPKDWEDYKNLYTIIGNEMRCGSAGSDTVVEAWYLSQGLTLVEKDTANLESGEANQPEWPWEFAHDLLFYEVCLMLSPRYKLRENDQLEAARLRKKLKHLSLTRQSTQAVSQELRGSSDPVDVYDRPGYINYSELD